MPEGWAPETPSPPEEEGSMLLPLLLGVSRRSLPERATEGKCVVECACEGTEM